VFAALFLITGLGTFAQQSAFRQLSPGGWALSWALMVLYAAPVFVLIYLLDLYEREPLPLVIAAFLWGAIVATQLAGFANAGWGLVVARIGGPEFASRWTAALTAPFVEETLKGMGVVFVFLIARDQVDDVMDGFVYGAVCGLGFAVVEDVFYFIGVFGGTTAGVLQGFFVRVLSSGFYGHVLYTGLVGMGIGYFVSRRQRDPIVQRLAVLVGLCAVAVAAHFVWNSPLFDLYPPQPWTGVEWLRVVLATTVKGAPLLAFVAVAVGLARGRERRWLRAALGPEAGGVAVSRGELEALENPSRRRDSRRAMRARAGAGAAQLLRRLQHEQIRLAVVRTRVGEGDAAPADVGQQRELCKSLRDALMAMPGAMPAAAGAPATAGPPSPAALEPPATGAPRRDPPLPGPPPAGE
jgi:RsiW-degrading membrane proteinase PrsW (M82 family)